MLIQYVVCILSEVSIAYELWKSKVIISRTVKWGKLFEHII